MSVLRAGEVAQTPAKAHWPCGVLVLLCGVDASPGF